MEKQKRKKSKKYKKQLAFLAEKALEELYPAVCSLDYGGEAWKLLVMSRLSAQCTDARVNLISVPLFERYPTLEDMAGADITELEGLVFSTGVYHVKARNIKDMCAMLLERHGGAVPDTMEGLLELPGVGRKIANLILGDVFGKSAVVADTHCIRLSGRIGLTSSKNPAIVERELREVLDPSTSGDFCHRLVHHGRAVCTARSPKCGVCTLRGFCEMGLSMANG